MRNLVYNLKRRYGSLVTYQRILSETVNLNTGLKEIERQTFQIRRAIRLPRQITLGILDVNGKIDFGGVYDKSARRIVVDKKDLPKDFLPQTNDYLIFSDERCNVKAVEAIDQGYLLMCVAYEGQPLEQTYTLSVESTLVPSQTGEGVI